MYNNGISAGGFASILAFIPNPIISTNEAWFLSNTEKVHALFHKINEIIDKVNSHEELFAKLKDILEKFDETVVDAVKAYIQEMYDNGELGRYVEEAILNAVKTNLIDGQPIKFKLVEQRVYNRGDNHIWGQSVTLNYSVFQGGVTIQKNGFIYHVQALRSCSMNTNSVSLRVYREGTSGAVATLDLTLDHANGMTYNPDNDNIYITHLKKYPGGVAATPYNASLANQVTNFVTEINFTALLNGNAVQGETIISKDAPQWFFDVAYNNGVLYGVVAYDASKDGGGSSYLRIYEYDFKNNTAELYRDYTAICPPNNRSCFEVDDNYFYFAHHSVRHSDIVVFRKSKTIPLSNARVRVWALPANIDNKTQFGEIESMTVMANGNLWISTFSKFNGEVAQYNEGCFSRTNIYTGVDLTGNSSDTPASTDTKGVVRFDVVLGTTGNYADVKPDGTASAPYRYLQMALNRIMVDDTIKHAEILVKGDMNYMANYYWGSTPIEIIGYGANGNDTRTPSSRGNMCYVGGLWLQDCAKVNVENLTLCSTVSGDNNFKNAPLVVQNATVTTDGVFCILDPTHTHGRTVPYQAFVTYGGMIATYNKKAGNDDDCSNLTNANVHTSNSGLKLHTFS